MRALPLSLRIASTKKLAVACHYSHQRQRESQLVGFLEESVGQWDLANCLSGKVSVVPEWYRSEVAVEPDHDRLDPSRRRLSYEYQTTPTLDWPMPVFRVNQSYTRQSRNTEYAAQAFSWNQRYGSSRGRTEETFLT